MSMTLDPALAYTGTTIANELGTWPLHVARVHPRLADVVGWARLQGLLARSNGDQARKAWSRLATWLEGLHPDRYPSQIEAVLEEAEGAPWRGPLSPKPPVTRAALVDARKAKPLPVCSRCQGFGTRTSTAEAD
ncbi:MAG: hypothetical protein M0R28_18125 [Pigmentiphaga sp.]|nr:hypothetical protein [Pigmentiphaga sp.]